MTHGKLNREQAIEIMGAELVIKLDSENCDYTNRAQTDGDDSVEFSASLKGIAKGDTERRTLIAYYYQSLEAVQENEGLGNLDWEISGYEIV